MQINFKILIIQNRWAFNLSNVFIGLEMICIGKSKYVAFWKWGPDHGDRHWLLRGAALVEAPLLLPRTCAPQPWDTIHRDMAVQVSFCGYLSPGAAKVRPLSLTQGFLTTCTISSRTTYGNNSRSQFPWAIQDNFVALSCGNEGM